ncbi:hypothetical protein ABI59_03910 [Acidobacteria bacterium Mor1]|nr:hypothetical protein ABI59_03910 [Acidobacteria bacterium Mor1]
MFTGLIETVGKVREVRPGRGSKRLTVVSDLPVAELVLGESIAVDGACLTVTAIGEDSFSADAVQETLDKTTLGGLRAGSRVNLERSLRLGDRLGGHLVQGHVDGTCPVAEVRSRGDDWRLRVRSSRELRPYLAPKGSVTLQGVSLTVSAVGPYGFEVALIPETLARTTLGDLKPGNPVNVEVDLLARYMENLLSERGR